MGPVQADRRRGVAGKDVGRREEEGPVVEVPMGQAAPDVARGDQKALAQASDRWDRRRLLKNC